MTQAQAFLKSEFIDNYPSELVLRASALLFSGDGSTAASSSSSSSTGGGSLTGVITGNNGSSSSFAPTSLLNANLSIDDLGTEDGIAFDYVAHSIYGRYFGTEDHLRDRIRRFVESNANQRKLVVITDADFLTPTMQSELREYTGRSTDAVQFVLTSVVSWQHLSLSAREEVVEREKAPLVFMESLQSRLTSRLFRSLLTA